MYVKGDLGKKKKKQREREREREREKEGGLYSLSHIE
jgi:hypothetical protein